MPVRLLAIVASTVTLLLAGHPALARARHRHAASCDVTTCAVNAALEEACPCSDALTHGQYVRCVAHAAKALKAGGVIGRRCRGAVVRLAAHAVCGQADAVVCLLPTSTCTADGSCANDPTVDCADDTDCGTHCAASTGNACDAGRGIAVDVGSCVFAGCASPSGAFLDRGQPL